MRLKTMWFACALAAPAAAPAAFAQADGGQAPVTTASPSANPAPPTTVQAQTPRGQVDALGFDLEDSDAGPPAPDRKIHGEFGVGIGSDGYREAWGVATAPIGDHASATVAVDDGQFRWRHRNIQNRSLGLSLAFGVDNRRPPPPSLCGGPGEPLWMTLTRREQLARDTPCP